VLQKSILIFNTANMNSTSTKISNDGVHDKDPELGFPRHEPSPTPAPNNRKHDHTIRTEINAFIGEFIGTFMFLSLAFAGTQIALNAAGSSQLTSSDDPVPDVGKLLYIAFAFGVSLAINVAIFAEISGGKFNPAVSSAQRSRPTPTPARRNHNNAIVVSGAILATDVVQRMLIQTRLGHCGAVHHP
jgi:glycerol uptake facilitator-like aquaporin